jgi:murein DD-endopeptidase MepM/ murein hydrolase activator NlpD
MKIVVTTVALNLVTLMSSLFPGPINSSNIKKEAVPNSIISIRTIEEGIEFPKDSSYNFITKIDNAPLGYPIDTENLRCQCKNVEDLKLRSFCSGFGYRFHPVLKTKRFHSGIDFSAKEGTPILSTVNGKVSKISYNPGYGKYIEISSGNYKTLNAHCLKTLVKEGQLVSVGDTIGLVGSTGLTTGPHVHYEVMKDGKLVNPSAFIVKQ